MKKTSYILIALIAAVAVISFITPPLTMRKLEIVTSVINPTGETISITTGICCTLEVKTDSYISSMVCRDEETDDKNTSCYVIISENPELTDPIVSADSSWNDYLTVTSHNDTVSVLIDFPDYDNEDNLLQLAFSHDNREVCHIQVPSGQLKKVKSDLDMTFRSFRDAVLRVEPYADKKFEDCSFRLLDT